MFTKNGNILKINGDWIKPSGSPVPPGPSLPPNTVRVRTNDGNVPYNGSNASYETATLVPGTTDVYDVYKSGTDFSNLLNNSSYIKAYINDKINLSNDGPFKIRNTLSIYGKLK